MTESARLSVDELRKIFDLTGKVAVVTGAGGTLGHALSKGLAVFGADVACWDIKTDIMEDVVADIRGLGRKATASAVNVTDDASVKAAMEGVIKDFGKVNVMVTVAGTAGNRQPAETFDIDEWQKVMDVNVRGTLLCAKHAGAEYIKQGGGGKVITIGSVRGFLGHPGATRRTAPPRAPSICSPSSWRPNGRSTRSTSTASLRPFSGPRSRSKSRTIRRWSRSSWRVSPWAARLNWMTSSARVCSSPPRRLTT